MEWLLASEEPAIRYLAAGESSPAEDKATRDALIPGPLVGRLLRAGGVDAEVRQHPYAKWSGAFWRLNALVDLGVPPTEPVVTLLEEVFAWIMSDELKKGYDRLDSRVRKAAREDPSVAGPALPRRHAVQDGYVLTAACRLGFAADPRSAQLANRLLSWQWPDGGWNCDVNATGRTSSLHESAVPVWSLWEYASATGEAAAGKAAAKAAEMILRRRLFRRSSGEPIHPEMLRLHYPPYWHYDILQGLTVLRRTGHGDDPRTEDAKAIVRNARLKNGRWRAGGRYWKGVGTHLHGEAVDWSASWADQIITLQALQAVSAVPIIRNN